MNAFYSSIHRLFSFVIRLLTAALFGLLLITNGGGCSSSTDQGNVNNTPQLSIPDFLPNKLIGFVMDNEGELIPFASLGGASTGSVGVTTDAAIPTASGWYEVRAEGYATSYTQASGKINGINVLSTSLTAVDTMAFHSVGGDDTVVTVGDPATPTLEANLTAATFDVDAVIELTVLEPGLLDTAYAPKDTTDDVYINYPFVISAQSVSDGSLLQPASGQVVELTLTDNGDLGDPPRLFWFDADQGMWIEQHDAACARVDANHVSCQLNHFSQHAGASALPPPPYTGGSRYDNAMSAAEKEYAESSKEFANSGEEDVCGIFNDALLDALMELINAALDHADSYPSEKAKAKLSDILGKLQVLSISNEGEGAFTTCNDVFGIERPGFLPAFSNPAEALRAKMEEVTDKLAENLLKNPQCPDISSIAKVMAEAQLLGMLETNERLHHVYENLLNNCNIWEGRIEYSLILPTAMASYPDYNIIMSPWFRGALNWVEYHDFKLVLHTSSATEDEEFGTFDGTDKVTTIFPQVEYREYADLPCSFPVYESTFRSGQPDPGVIEASFKGDYDSTNGFVPYIFTTANNIEIEWGSFFVGHSTNDSGVCVTADDFTSIDTFPYRGQLAEQYADEQYLFGDSATPGNDVFANFSGDFSSIWDIINRGPTQPAPPSTENNHYPKAYYSGSEILFDAYSFGLYDGMQIVMRWHIEHTDYTQYKYDSDTQGN